MVSQLSAFLLSHAVGGWLLLNCDCQSLPLSHRRLVIASLANSLLVAWQVSLLYLLFSQTKDPVPRVEEEASHPSLPVDELSRVKE